MIALQKGILCMQHWIKTEDDQNACVEFYLVSNEDEEDSEV